VTLAEHIDREWQESILPALHDYIRIPNVSVAFDPQWDEHGHMREHAVESFTLSGWHRAPFVPAMPSGIEIRSALGTMRVRQSAFVDRGPFYVRSLVEGELGGESGRGIAEHVVVDAIDRPIHRPFVDMRVQHTRGPNSFWLPLFVGPRHSRLHRLLDRSGG